MHCKRCATLEAELEFPEPSTPHVDFLSQEGFRRKISLPYWGCPTPPPEASRGGWDLLILELSVRPNLLQPPWQVRFLLQLSCGRWKGGFKTAATEAARFSRGQAGQVRLPKQMRVCSRPSAMLKPGAHTHVLRTGQASCPGACALGWFIVQASVRRLPRSGRSGTITGSGLGQVAHRQCHSCSGRSGRPGQVAQANACV